MSLEEVEGSSSENKMLYQRASVKISNLSATYGVISDELNIDNPKKKKGKDKLNGVDNFSFISEEKAAGREEINSLKNVSLEARPGQLTIVVGPVGSGKSTLLQAILSELRITGGTIDVKGVLSYSSQEAWIFAGKFQLFR